MRRIGSYLAAASVADSAVALMATTSARSATRPRTIRSLLVTRVDPGRHQCRLNKIDVSDRG